MISAGGHGHPALDNRVLSCVLITSVFSVFESVHDALLWCSHVPNTQVGTDIRLDNRVLDMRVPAQNAINRISSVPYP